MHGSAPRARDGRAAWWPAAVVVALACSLGQPAAARDDAAVKPRPGFGGPDAVENQLADDAEIAPALVDERPFQPWFDWKAGLAQRTGISFGVDYSALYLGSTNDAGTSSASAGMARFFGSWELIGRGTENTGALVWKVEHRHRYGSLSPNQAALGAYGYVGFIGAPFSDQQVRLTNLYWRQRLGDGRATVIGGYLDATDYADTFIGGSPWTGFLNLAFSTGSASMFLPNDATLGVAGGAMLTDNVYAIAGLTNAFADPTDPFDRSLDRFVSDGEHFATLEIGWTASQQRIYHDNTHLTVWHVDDSVAAGATQGWGVAFSHVRGIGERWTAFLRGGLADDGSSLLETSVSAGVLYRPESGGDELGVAVNWGEPNESTFGPGLDDQLTVEAFYRLQVTPELALTPSVELIKDPALNPRNDTLWVLGVRARLAL
jgi:porin